MGAECAAAAPGDVLAAGVAADARVGWGGGVLHRAGSFFVRQHSILMFECASRLLSLWELSAKKASRAFEMALRIDVPSAAVFSSCGPHFLWDQWIVKR
jgi:hypothetical protein